MTASQPVVEERNSDNPWTPVYYRQRINNIINSIEYGQLNTQLDKANYLMTNLYENYSQLAAGTITI